MASGSAKYKSTNRMRAGKGKSSAAKSRRKKYGDYGELPI